MFSRDSVDKLLTLVEEWITIKGSKRDTEMFTSFSAAVKQLKFDYASNQRQWLEVEPSEYDERLSMLDPLYMESNAFLMGGCVTHNDNNEDLYIAFRRESEKVEILLMTTKEWRQRSGFSCPIPDSPGFPDYLLALHGAA